MRISRIGSRTRGWCGRRRARTEDAAKGGGIIPPPFVRVPFMFGAATPAVAMQPLQTGACLGNHVQNSDVPVDAKRLRSNSAAECLSGGYIEPIMDACVYPGHPGFDHVRLQL